VFTTSLNLAELPLAGPVLVRTSFYDRYFLARCPTTATRRCAIVAVRAPASATRRRTRAPVVINDPAPAAPGGRGRAGTGPYLTTVREDEGAEWRSLASSSAPAASPGSRHQRAQSSVGSGLARARRTMSNRFMSSVHKIRSYTQQSNPRGAVRDRTNSPSRAGFNVTNLVQGHRHHGRALRRSAAELGLHRGHLSGRRPVLLHRLSASRLSLHGCPRTTGAESANLKSYRMSAPWSGPGSAGAPSQSVSVVEMFGGMCLYIILLASTSSSLMKGANFGNHRVLATAPTPCSRHRGCMRRPNSYPAMLTVSFGGVAAIVKTIMGVMAVLIFGMATEQSSAANLEVDATILASSRIRSSLSRFLQFIERIRCDLPWAPSTRTFHRERQLALAVDLCSPGPSFMTAGLFLSMLVPHFALLIGLVGSFTGTASALSFRRGFTAGVKRKQLNAFGVFVRVCIQSCFAL
uniref:H(+)-exporting diphosphatase n=1 Tax=Macrostomum lignano TaxID=282301 RepID=A0A1I8FFU7_9PLAT